MNPSAFLHKQLKDNANDLQEFYKDLKNWGDEMKRKETVFKSQPIPTVTRGTIRNEANPNKKPKVTSTNYAAWDKFDADAECERIDKDEVEEQPIDEEATIRAKKHKEEGNQFVKEQQWEKAIDSYTAAIREHSMEAVFYANRALCYLKLSQMENVENDCDIAIKLDDSYVKAYQRRAAAREALNNFKGAEEDLLTVLKFEPKNKESITALEKLRKKCNETPQRPVSKFTASRKTDLNEPSRSIDVGKPEPFATQESERIFIKSIFKPPHLRSNKPLKRIKIEEFETSQQKPKAFKSDIIEKHEEIKSAIEKESYDSAVKRSDLILQISEKRKASEGITKCDGKELALRTCNDILMNVADSPPKHMQENVVECEHIAKLRHEAINKLKNLNIPETLIDKEIQNEITSQTVEDHEIANSNEKVNVVTAPSNSEKFDNLTETKTTLLMDSGQKTIDISTPHNKKEVTADLKSSQNAETNEKIVVLTISDKSQETKTKSNFKAEKSNAKIKPSPMSSKKQANSIPPKNAVQFNEGWKNLKCLSEKFEYIKGINPKHLPAIFQESLDSHVLSCLLEILAKCFIENKLGVYTYLHNLTKVKRFSLFTMFFTQSDKDWLWKCINYIRDEEKIPADQIKNLEKRYELTKTSSDDYSEDTKPKLGKKEKAKKNKN